MADSESSASASQLAATGLSYLHVLVIFGVTFFVVIVFFALSQSRLAQRRKNLADLPRVFMPTIPPFVTKKARTYLENETARCRSLFVEPIIDRETEKMQKLGWGTPGKMEEEVHFKTSVAKSYVVLQRAVQHKHPTLRFEPTMTVRSYVHSLRDHLPELTTRQCNAYIETYERARFGEEEFSEEQYGEFMKQFIIILQQCES